MTGPVLVTGAAGFLGFHLTRLLSSRGLEVVAVDVGVHPDAERKFDALTALPGVEVRRLDLGDGDAVATLPDVVGVYHLAALNGTQHFYDRPFTTLRHSTTPTVNLLQRYIENQPDFFFYAGSSEAYASTVSQFDWPVPTDETVPLAIDDPRNPRWSYGASKLHGEVACFAAQTETGLPVVVGRFHNAYGPQMGTNHVIPDFISRGRNGVFELYGASQTRSFIYVDDAVAAVTEVASRAIGEVVNIGGAAEIVIRDLAEVIMREAGWDGSIVEHPAPRGSVERRAPDISRLRDLVDVERFVPLEEGIRRTLADYLGTGP